MEIQEVSGAVFWNDSMRLRILEIFRRFVVGSLGQMCVIGLELPEELGLLVILALLVALERLVSALSVTLAQSVGSTLPLISELELPVTLVQLALV